MKADNVSETRLKRNEPLQTAVANLKLLQICMGSCQLQQTTLQSGNAVKACIRLYLVNIFSKRYTYDPASSVVELGNTETADRNIE